MRVTLAIAAACVFSNQVAAQKALDAQTVVVGPWTIATGYKGDKFLNCTMTRTVGDLGFAFVRDTDGLMLEIDSSKWRLERGKAYPIRLTAGSQTLDAKAQAEAKSVTITLVDRPFNERLRIANVLEVRGEGATLKMPLDGSAAGLDRLDQCFDKNIKESPEANPFVAPGRKP